MSKNYPDIEETVFSKVLDNGLVVYIIKKEGFKKMFATFATRFGSTVNKFVPIDDDQYIEVPLGVAHFLEHKVFEMPDGEDASMLFAKYGAEANAFTDYNQTAYIVSSTSYYHEVIETLLDYVQVPYFTDENVEKEQGIILQELKMYQDNANDRLYNHLMKNLFRKNLHREEILGNEQSISTITKEVLYKCYETFYHPSNMCLCIVGDFDVDETFKVVENNQNKKEFPPFKEIKKEYVIEDNTVYRRSGSCTMDIVMPKVTVAVKLPSFEYEEDELLSIELQIKILLEMLFGFSSKNYQEMLDNGIINGLSYDCSLDDITGFIRISASSFKNKEFIAYVKKKLLEIKHLEIDIELLENIKKGLIGNYIRALNDVEFISTSYIDYKFKNCDLFHIIKIIKDINKESLKHLFVYFVNSAITSYSILPKEVSSSKQP